MRERLKAIASRRAARASARRGGEEEPPELGADRRAPSRIPALRVRLPKRGRGILRPRIGVRTWLAASFAAVGIITALSVYFLVTDTSQEAAEAEATELAVGRTVGLAQRLGTAQREEVREILDATRSENFAVWAFGRSNNLISPRNVLGVSLNSVDGRSEAIALALSGRPFISVDPDQPEVSIAAQPVFRDNEIAGAVVSRSTRSPEVRSVLRALEGDRLRALGVAAAIALLIGALIATVITTRVKRLAEGAGRIAEGKLDRPLQESGRDEIGDLGRSLDAMRVALRDSFGALASERDRLGAVLGGLSEAVIVVGRDGRVRFSNPAADPLIDNGRPLEPLEPWLTRAAHGGTAQHNSLGVGERLYALQARDLPAEGATLLVVRDRTDELRRDQVEREFVSNAAHELRNPIAGISGAIEVLQSGAKNDEQARDHFLSRLADDSERLSRLTHSLLTLARIESVGEGAAVPVTVAIVAKEAAEVAGTVEGVELEVEVDEDLVAVADQALLRQVLIGLLTNAFKNTPPPGVVTLRARRDGEIDVLVEVADTGSGIPAEERDRIFERFYRGSDTLEQEGFGLGLAIARRMVDVMGGVIRVESEVGVGSTFSVRLPLAQASPAPVA
jgi:two-component system phosphate regulon sensor histidine kinase PhoR